jgi:hypothetical protein
MLFPRRNITAHNTLFISYLLKAWAGEDRGEFNAHLFALEWAILSDYNIITYEGSTYSTNSERPRA